MSNRVAACLSAGVPVSRGSRWTPTGSQSVAMHTVAALDVLKGQAIFGDQDPRALLELYVCNKSTGEVLLLDGPFHPSLTSTAGLARSAQFLAPGLRDVVRTNFLTDDGSFNEECIMCALIDDLDEPEMVVACPKTVVAWAQNHLGWPAAKFPRELMKRLNKSETVLTSSRDFAVRVERLVLASIADVTRPLLRGDCSKCARCGAQAAQQRLARCGQCKAVAYCNRDCQAEHWRSQHRGDCERMRKRASDITVVVSDAGSLSRDLLLLDMYPVTRHQQ